MQTLAKILVAIRDPHRRSQRALKKAAYLATRCGARLELYHAISEPLSLDPLTDKPDALLGREGAIQERHLRRLERLAEPLRKQGISVACAATWDFPAAHAIVRRAQQTRANLIVADGHASHAGRWLLRFTDWELLRLSPKPVLFVKSSRAYGRSPTVLVALDPGHAADKPARLDKQILATATLLRARLGAQLHALHAYPVDAMGARPQDMAKEGFAARLLARAHAHASKAIDRELKAARLADATRHLVARHPANAVPETAAKVHADIVVMGAISRSGLRRVFFGNTAERVLDDLHCDVLVVKPAGFDRRVAHETSGPDLRPLPLRPWFV